MFSRKFIAIAVLVLAIVLILTGIGRFWYGKSPENPGQNNVANQPSEQTLEPESETRFVTDIDPDVSHWQTKETQFFTIKFPKEWYWVEILPRGQGQARQHVISNNPNFPLEKYSDIGMSTGSTYHVVVHDVSMSDIAPSLDDTEVVITDHGWPTSNSGTSKDSIDWVMQWAQAFPGAYCIAPKSSPLAASCSFVDGNIQKVQTYFLAYDKMTFGFTARTTKESNAISMDILEKIAKSIVVKDSAFH